MTLWPNLWPQRVYFYCRSDADSAVGLWFDLLSISHLWALSFDSETISHQGVEKINNVPGQQQLRTSSYSPNGLPIYRAPIKAPPPTRTGT